MTFDMTDPNLQRNASHLRDDQLLLYANGELPEPSAELASHVESCLQCKARLAELEGTLVEFIQSQHTAFAAPLPSAAGPRALLKAQLSDLSPPKGSKQDRSGETVWPAALHWRRGLAFAVVTLILMFVASRGWRRIEASKNMATSVLADEPNARFTPGAVIAATQNQVCTSASEVSAVVPQAIKNQVLQLYGVSAEQSDAYEVDYLITPELGGATDIRNLWPEPYDHTMWNAHVKDRLENRLRELVCHGDLDLATAQRDISTDWIAAYRKYFHADVPINVPVGSS
jgi:hypothetical protein